MTIHLRSLRYESPTQGDSLLQRNASHSPDAFPFTVPIIRSLDELTFPTPVTMLIGENGSGKSTLLEAIAASTRLPAVGSIDTERDDTLAAVRQLGDALRLVWNKRTHRGFFMRSEDFFGFVKQVNATRSELLTEIQRVEVEYADRSEKARGLARMPFVGELHDLTDKYGVDLDAQSHGESYFKLFQSRFVPDGLYLLDEPEAPLSPMRQLALLAMLKQMVDAGGQFIIATHSPILMAYPGATLYNCENGHIQAATYDDLEHVTVMRDFMLNRETYLRHLFE